MKRSLFFALPFLLIATMTQAQSTTWQIDKVHSRIGFTVRHLGLSKVRGEFTDYDATIVADAKTGKITSVDATAKAESVDTGNEKRDKHLRSDDFFSASKHPELRLKTKSVKFEGNDFTAKVDLTLRGVTKQVTLTGSLLGVRKVDFGDGPRNRAAYEAEATINRKDFGLAFNALAEGVSVVSDKVELNLELEIFTAAK